MKIKSHKLREFSARPENQLFSFFPLFLIEIDEVLLVFSDRNSLSNEK